LCLGGSGIATCPVTTGARKTLTCRAPRNTTTPHLEDRSPYSNDQAACWGWQDAGAISARSRTMPRTTTTPDAIAHSVLPTVLDCCIPAARGETTTSAIPCTCTRPSLCL